VFKELLTQVKEMMQAALADDEIYDLAAQNIKKSYSALLEVRFSAEQALLIVANQGTIFSANNNS
jgi:hypothetical protein